MSSFTPINRPAGAPAPSLTPAETGLLTPPPTPPPINVGAALFHFGMATPPPSPPASLPPPPPHPTPVTPVRARARPSATPRPRKRVLCKECNRDYSYKNIADHMKVHQMYGDDGGLARPCKQCKKHPERCYVAIHPEKLNTYSCACCLSSHKHCSFKSIKIERRGVWAERHPFLLEKDNIPPKEEDSTSVSSEEENLHGRPWELQ